MEKTFPKVILDRDREADGIRIPGLRFYIPASDRSSNEGFIPLSEQAHSHAEDKIKSPELTWRQRLRVQYEIFEWAEYLSGPAG